MSWLYDTIIPIIYSYSQVATSLVNSIAIVMYIYYSSCKWFSLHVAVRLTCTTHNVMPLAVLLVVGSGRQTLPVTHAHACVVGVQDRNIKKREWDDEVISSCKRLLPVYFTIVWMPAPLLELIQWARVRCDHAFEVYHASVIIYHLSNSVCL